MICVAYIGFMYMGRSLKAGACLLAWFAASGPAFAAGQCARADEMTAIRATAVQQQLMVAALTCNQVSNFNAFQTSFGKELRRSDARLLSMFKRFYGARAGEKEYHAFKTRIANDSSIRSIRDNRDYCSSAQVVFAAALTPQKPTLANFVSGVQITESSPVDSCEIRVAVGLQGAKAVPSIVPRPKPALTQTAATIR